MFVHQYNKDSCWICGTSGNPSREHKFKASDLRRHFGDEKMYVRVADEVDGIRFAQGPNSGHLKFTSKICEGCNSSVTQASDVAYDEFIRTIERDGGGDDAIRSALSALEHSTHKTPLFRYFAKLLGCHLADVGAPIPRHLSRFVAKKSARNCIWLSIRSDPTFHQMADALPDERVKYAAHGGLVVIAKKPKLLPSRLYSTLTIGSIQFLFYYVLNALEIWEMRMRHPEFVRWCAETAQLAIEEPIPQSDLERLGLT